MGLMIVFSFKICYYYSNFDTKIINKMSGYNYKWKLKFKSIKLLGLCELIFGFLLPLSLCIVFILSRLLKLIPEPTLPNIEIPGITDKMTKLDESVPLIIKIRLSILCVMFLLAMANCIANFYKIKLLNDAIKKCKKEEMSSAKRKKNIYIFGGLFCFLCCFLIFADCLVTILKITDVIKNQHFYNILLSCSIFYALMPLFDLVMFVMREFIKCIYYDKISENKDSWQAKIYSKLSNIDHVMGIFCFIMDLYNWKNIERNIGSKCLSEDYEVKHHSSNAIDPDDPKKNFDEPEKYTFLLFYFIPIEVTKVEI